MYRKNIDQILHAIVENDDQLAFKEVYRYYSSGLISFVTSLLNDRQTAEEVVEDVFVKLWDNRKTLHTIHSIVRKFVGIKKNPKNFSNH